MVTFRNPNIERLRKEIFGGRIRWEVSPRLGPSLRYAETPDAYFFNKTGTDLVYVQPKKPEGAPAICYSDCERIREKKQIITNWAEYGPGPTAGVDTKLRTVRYCPKCEPEPKCTEIEIDSI